MEDHPCIRCPCLAGIRKKVSSEIMLLQRSYEVADDHRQNVYLVKKPRNRIEATERLVYIVLESQADEWEMANGQLIHWRERCT